MKWFAKIVLIGLILAGVSGCGGGGGTPTSDTAPPAPIQQLKKTGQTKIYDASGAEHTRAEADSNASLRDDGYYQTGVTPNYTRDDTKNIVTDHITGLEWQDDAEASSVTKNWEDAKSYCSTLPLDGGRWRLPTIDELMYIADRSKRNPAIDTTWFQNVVSGFYWSSTTDVRNEDFAWYVYFYGGSDFWIDKSHAYHVRCVRAGQE